LALTLHESLEFLTAISAPVVSISWDFGYEQGCFEGEVCGSCTKVCEGVMGLSEMKNLVEEEEEEEDCYLQ
jgi:hypothetical protein